MTASYTTLPVIGVPINTRALEGKDSLLSILQMPGGIPVATVAIGNALNAGLLAAQILALSDESLGQRLTEYRGGLEQKVAEMNSRVARRSDQ